MRFRQPLIAGAALVLGLLGGTASTASAEPEEAGPSCGLVDQMRAALRDEVGPGVGGVRSVLRQPYWLFEVQQNDVKAKLDILEGGADHLRDLDDGEPVPGLAPLLGQFEAAVAEARKETEDIFYFRVLNVYTQTPVLSRHPIRPSYWEKLDRVDDLSDQIDDFLDNVACD
ncbi:hypothetical protein [Segniliparus rugosus]|uniref:Uncharacterized protein n=1 Tax=Segniliparus rugosus (strain ATCC BAA-974 / DSM 45345 / CCUG 50838 / CIP 108380 / JCM 13579 / CDC 945) TaxID=679197 RepID=E5XTR4_SEGRC|nr:hypothetical protein [Segniliparus rugosus]EFV12267.1 hypothetical protein HMPREF9336_02886 [Segniliparus rugosus ATCC BAA-974]